MNTQRSQAERLWEGATEIEPERRLKAVNVGDLLAMDIPPRKMLLAPVLPRQGLVMLYSKRGVGKTNLGLRMAYAVAAGGPCLRWEAPKPNRVLFIDGEMPLITLQERLASIVAGASEEIDPEFLRIIAADHQTDGIPDLSTEDGQSAIEPYLRDGVDLVVLDNLSTLCRSGRENESESWGPVQEWALSLRRRDISVLLVHHAGKGGHQRGTSRREDVLDTIISLRHPEDYSPTEGARFEVHFEKARGIVGDEAKPFEARLEVVDGAALWSTRDLEDAEIARAVALYAEDMSVRDVASEMGISKSKAQRLRAKADEAGLL